MPNYLIEIKAFKRSIFGKYYNMLNCLRNKQELNELYDSLHLFEKFGISLNELYSMVHCGFTNFDYNYIKNVYEYSQLVKGYLNIRNKSLAYPYTNVVRIYNLPSIPIYTLIEELKALVKNASNIELIQTNDKIHAAITFKKPEQAMFFVLNNTYIKFNKRFCIVAFGYPENHNEEKDKDIKQGYSIAVSTFTALDL
jgi:hypothetical protein